MSNSLCSTSLTSFKPATFPSVGLIAGNDSAPKVFLFNNSAHKSRIAKFQPLQVKAADDSDTDKPVTKINSLVCQDCEGNGAVLCTQCLGNGINSKDHFNGMFKAGGLCWLCRGKRDILCGSCNGAGFMGGFMSTADS